MSNSFPSNRTLLGIAALLLLASAAGYVYQSRQPVANPDPNHTHADFAVWIEGVQVDFGDARYMSDHDDSNGRVQLDKYLHFHDGNPAVIHRHKPGLAIGEFLQSLGWKKDIGCVVTDRGGRYCSADGNLWRMLVNGEERPFDWAYVFADEDRILLSYGPASTAPLPTEQLQSVTDQSCLYSKTCPWRGDAPTEGCVADPDVPCMEAS